MKNKHIQIIFVIAATLNASEIISKAQNFTNLGFESALGSPITGGPGASSIGPFYNLPGWTVVTVGDQGSAYPGGVFYNTSILDGTDAYIATNGAYCPIVFPTISPLAGHQSLALYVSGYPDTVPLPAQAPASISISQTGTIPLGQNSVSFLLGYFATWLSSPGQNPLSYFSLSINNQNVPLVVTSENGQVLTVAGDISQWAGESVTLTIANSVTASSEGESFGVIDNVAFSPQVVTVPEPSGIGLLAAAISLSAVILNKRKIA